MFRLLVGGDLRVVLEPSVFLVGHWLIFVAHSRHWDIHWWKSSRWNTADVARVYCYIHCEIIMCFFDQLEEARWLDSFAPDNLCHQGVTFTTTSWYADVSICICFSPKHGYVLSVVRIVLSSLNCRFFCLHIIVLFQFVQVLVCYGKSTEMINFPEVDFSLPKVFFSHNFSFFSTHCPLVNLIAPATIQRHRCLSFDLLLFVWFQGAFQFCCQEEQSRSLEVSKTESPRTFHAFEQLDCTWQLTLCLLSFVLYVKHDVLKLQVGYATSTEAVEFIFFNHDGQKTECAESL